MKNISFGGKFISILLCIVMASFFMPSFSFAENESDNLEYDGYLVAVKDGSDVDTGNNDIEEVIEDEIYMADSISDIREEIPANDIRYIEPNYIMELCDEYVPNDTYYGQNKWMQNIMNVQSAWKRGRFGNYTSSSDAPTVAIIDTGIIGTGVGAGVSEHEDLNYDNISAGKNTIKDNTNTEDDNGHGTFIAGIISGIHNNAVGVAGNMPNIKLKAYKCVTMGGKAVLSDEIEAINAAVKDSVDVINLSLAMGGNSSAEQEAINAAVEKGIIVCASAGNAGNAKMTYPASHENVISVGSLNSSMKKSSYSQYNKMVDCIAPGENIMSLDRKSTNGYKVGSGTSFSNPQVVALAAMCKSVDPSINHDRFLELLKSTSKDAGDVGYDTSYGWGIIDFGNMLDALMPQDNSIWAADITGISSEAEYTGSAITFDKLKITMPDGTELREDSDYKVSYFNNIKSEVAMAVIEGIGDYTGRMNTYFNITGIPEEEVDPESGKNPFPWKRPTPKPTPSAEPTPTPAPIVEPEPIIEPEPIVEPEPTSPSGGGTVNPTPSTPTSPTPAVDKASEKVLVSVPNVSISKPKAGKKSFTITWGKKSVDGYKLQYGTSKSFKKNTYKTEIIKKSKTSYKVKNLKSKKKYYVRMCSYISKGGCPYWSDWTAVEFIKTK